VVLTSEVHQKITNRQATNISLTNLIQAQTRKIRESSIHKFMSRSGLTTQQNMGWVISFQTAQQVSISMTQPKSLLTKMAKTSNTSRRKQETKLTRSPLIK